MRKRRDCAFKKISIHLDVEHFRFRNAILNPSDKNCKIIDKISESSYDVCHCFGRNSAEIHESIVPIRFQLKCFCFAFATKTTHGDRDSFETKNCKASNGMPANSQTDSDKRHDQIAQIEVKVFDDFLNCLECSRDFSLPFLRNQIPNRLTEIRKSFF